MSVSCAVSQIPDLHPGCHVAVCHWCHTAVPVSGRYLVLSRSSVPIIILPKVAPLLLTPLCHPLQISIQVPIYSLQTPNLPSIWGLWIFSRRGYHHWRDLHCQHLDEHHRQGWCHLHALPAVNPLIIGLCVCGEMIGWFYKSQGNA